MAISLAASVSSLMASCVTLEDKLCLNGRFAVSLAWQANGSQGQGYVGKSKSGEWLETGSAGNMWMFAPDNLEFLVKSIDACSFNGHWWIFYAATTDVEFTLTVEDTETGAQNQYKNVSGRAAEPVQDTIAVSCAGPHFTFSTKRGVSVSGKLPPVLVDFEEPKDGTLAWTAGGEISYTPDISFSGIENMWFHRQRAVGKSGHEVEVIEHRRLSIVVDFE